MAESPNQMSKRKRVLGVDTANIIEGSESRRAKRRKDGPSAKVAGSADDMSVDVEGDGDGDDDEDAYAPGGTTESKRGVSELGLQILETLKKATNSHGILLSSEFLKLPNKRQYADYYTQIKQPIAFDDIQTKLDEHQYQSLEDVKADFDLCFTNARRYNMKNSDIWNAARDLHRLSTDTYRALQPSAPESEFKSEDEDDDDQGQSTKHGDKRKGGRSSAFSSKYTARMNKLIEKKNSEGHQHSLVFMDLVPKKEYPDYYRIIKKPICFNQILKRIRDKKYNTPREFMNDVELVFTNATTFNEDHSQIWEDAKTLQATFHALCSDWRAEYPDTAPSNNTVPKLKLKVSQTNTKTEPTTVRLPHLGGSTPAAATPQTQRHQSGTPTQPRPTPAQTHAASSTPARPTPPTIPTHVHQQQHAQKSSRSPSIVPHPPRIIAVELVTLPAGRRITLKQYGISKLEAFALALGEHETSLEVGVQLVSDAGQNGAVGQNGVVPVSDGGSQAESLEVKCNAAVLTGGDKGGGKSTRWDVPLVVGGNSLEVRVKGTGRPGRVWRIAVARAV